jgi:archaemetzincin
MNGSNHLAEADRRPLEFCPECLPKIWWTCGVNPVERFGHLLEFADKHQLTTAASLWCEARDRLTAAKRSDQTTLDRRGAGKTND